MELQLIEAVCNNDQSTLIELIKQGVDLNATEDEAGITALHHAVQRNLPEIVTLLLLAGADPEAETCEGATPLDVAKFNKHHHLVDLIMRFMSMPKVSSVQ